MFGNFGVKNTKLSDADSLIYQQAALLRNWIEVFLGFGQFGCLLGNAVWMWGGMYRGIFMRVAWYFEEGSGWLLGNAAWLWGGM